MEIYHGLDLDPASRQIRILKLQAAGFEDAPLLAELLVVSLDESPKYFALSYTWGEAVFDHFIVCNTHHFGITKNLHQALTRLRKSGKRTLWVDQICIYSHRTITKHLGIMRFAPQFSEGFNFTYLVS